MTIDIVITTTETAAGTGSLLAAESDGVIVITAGITTVGGGRIGQFRKYHPVTVRLQENAAYGILTVLPDSNRHRVGAQY
jgi:hypothetical protein